MNTKVTTLAALVSSVLLWNVQGGGRPDKSATRRYGNAAGDDVAGANFCS